MSKEITTAVGVGILGLGLTYIGFKIFTNRSSKSKPIDKNCSRNSDSEISDICILYTEGDLRKVETFKENIRRNIDTKYANVTLMDEIGYGKTIFRAFEQAMKSSTYIFLFVTENFCNDEENVFLADAGLSADLRSSKTLWRLVPVWVDSGIDKSKNCPCELSVLQGLHYDRFLENVQQTKCFEDINKLLRKSRKKEKMEDMKRELEDD